MELLYLSAVKNKWCIMKKDLNPFGSYLFILQKNQHKYLNNALKEYDLSIIQALFLIRLNICPDFSQNDLAKFFFLSKGTVAKNIAYLEENGFIERERIPKNRRKNRIKLTEKSVNLIPTFKQLNDEWERKAGVDKLSDEFIDKFIELTSRSVELNEGEKDG